LADPQFAAARNAANMSPSGTALRAESPSRIAKRGFVICTGETWRRHSSTQVGISLRSPRSEALILVREQRET
jgi:hypothetical protein